MNLLWLAKTQALESSLGDALGTMNEAFEVNPDELVYRPECPTPGALFPV
jgi:hypothetical protein